MSAGVAVGAVAAGAGCSGHNILGIWVLGSINDWQHWLDAATVYGWRWMRQRLLARESGDDARKRLIRSEAAAVIAVSALEISLMVQE